MFKVALISVFSLAAFSPVVDAARGISIGLGMEYLPMAKVEFGNPVISRYEIYDNMSIESGLYYNFDTGFRTGAVVSLFSKSINPGANGNSDISSWGIGVLGDYEYRISESGSTGLVFGMDAGYGRFKDSNNFSKRTDDSYWAAFFGGIRYFPGARYFLELDYRMKWQEFDLVGVPADGIPDKTFKFSGSSLRLSLGYGFFSHQNSMEN